MQEVAGIVLINLLHTEVAVLKVKVISVIKALQQCMTVGLVLQKPLHQDNEAVVPELMVVQDSLAQKSALPGWAILEVSALKAVN